MAGRTPIEHATQHVHLRASQLADRTEGLLRGPGGWGRGGGGEGGGGEGGGGGGGGACERALEH